MGFMFGGELNCKVWLNDFTYRGEDYKLKVYY